MTNEEAIEFLKYAMENPNPNGNLTDEHTQIVLQVINLAIKALEEQRPQGDLISREALRKVFSDWHNWHTVIGYGKVVFLDKLLEEIDNAPTVEERSYEQGVIDGRDTEFDNGFEQGYAKGYENCEHDNERPQGKWLHPYVTNIACECSNCNLQLPITDYFNFCPNCGAYMRKGDED